MCMRSMKLLGSRCVMVVLFLAVCGQLGQAYKMRKNQEKGINKSLKFMIYNVQQIIKTYEIFHLIRSNGWMIPDRKNLAWTCKLKTRKEQLSLRDQANEIMKILQKFVSELQQMQIDETRLPRPSYEITRAIRFLEYDLRDVTEVKIRSFIKKKIGPVKVSYSLGNLPSTMSCCRPKSIRAMHVYKLHMLMSCISDIRHVAYNRWMNLKGDKNGTKDRFG